MASVFLLIVELIAFRFYKLYTHGILQYYYNDRISVTFSILASKCINVQYDMVYRFIDNDNLSKSPVSSSKNFLIFFNLPSRLLYIFQSEGTVSRVLGQKRHTATSISVLLVISCLSKKSQRKPNVQRSLRFSGKS